MKTLKLFSTLLLGMFALTALTSCLGDDDDNGTSATMLETEEQRTNALSSMVGSYNGTLYYYDPDRAYSLEFSSSGGRHLVRGIRHLGFPVRAVRVSQN